MKVSFITTVLNEEDSIEDFLKSLAVQTRQFDEVVIVDGGSTDATVERISNIKSKISNLKLIIKKGNRSVGRNEAIRRASGDVIAIADAGCVLDKEWSENIIKLFGDAQYDVVAGYYKGKADTTLQKCLVPYVLVMPDKVNPQNFLPATRSMAMKRTVWEDLGGFPEEFSHNEDYVFAKRLQKAGKKIAFAKDAVVEWIPPKSVNKIYTMFYRFALGDAEAGILRPKVAFLIARYVVGIILLIIALILDSKFLLGIVVLGFILYLFWAIWKNYRYVKKITAIFYLPLLQLLSDLAVIHGTVYGLFGIKKK